MSDAAIALLRRRRLLEWGGAACGLNLGGLLRARVQAEESQRQLTPPRIRSCILVFYYGGPSHLETFDMKPNAPATVRGEFQPIATSVPGLQICEHMPRMARLMHQVCLIRSMAHQNRLHDAACIESLTGRPSPNGDREEFSPISQFFPCYGAAVASRLQDRSTLVPHAALPYPFRNVIEVPCQGGGILGNQFDPLQINVNVGEQRFEIGATAPAAGLSSERFEERRRLLTAISNASSQPTVASSRLDSFYEQAYRLLNADWLRQVLDISRESEAVRLRYGFDVAPLETGDGPDGNNGPQLAAERQLRGQNLLLARRLVEAGVPFVNVYDFRQQGRNWDAHFNVFGQHKDYLLPIADQALAALIEDLDERGLLDSTLVIAMGEFGRTPNINPSGGRDHWPDCYSILLAGGGIRGGSVYGSSDRLGAYPETDPVSPADLAATIFSRFGIPPSAEYHDRLGRPFRFSDGQPLDALFG